MIYSASVLPGIWLIRVCVTSRVFKHTLPTPIEMQRNVQMMNKPPFNCETYFVQSYENAQSYYGNLDLDYTNYVNHLVPIIYKYVGENPQKLQVSDFLEELHTNDLYLTIACAQKSEIAWQQFDNLFRGYIYDIAKFESSSRDAALDLSNNIMADMYFSDSSNQPRIASFEGRSTLSRWLRVIILHRAINERERKCNQMEGLDGLPEIADEKSLEMVELPVRANTYRPIIIDTFKGASRSLSEREQNILLMRYEEKLQVNEIARVIGVHASRITRQLQRIHEKMRLEVIAILAQRYGFSEETIEECLTDMLENPEYPILDLIKAS
jgi:RNA polymerase sigma-70 factor